MAIIRNCKYPVIVRDYKIPQACS